MQLHRPAVPCFKGGDRRLEALGQEIGYALRVDEGGQAGKGDAARGIPSLAGQAPGFLRDQMRLFKQDARNPGDAALSALKAIMKTVPDERIPDLAAYYSSLR